MAESGSVRPLLPLSVSAGFLFPLALLVTVTMTPGVVGAGTTEAPDCSEVGYDGDGSASDPYEVGNVSQLQCIGDENSTTGLSDNYTQVSDIDASGTGEWNPTDKFEEEITNTDEYNRSKLTRTPVAEILDTEGVNTTIVDASEGTVEFNQDIDEDVNVVYRTEDDFELGFEPIGEFGFTNDTGFTGTYTDSDYVISNLTIDRRTESYIGLFEAIDVALIQGVQLKNVYITGGRTAGGLVGRNSQGEVSDSHATGEIIGKDIIGGLIGLSDDGTVSKSHSAGNVNGSSSVVGGLIGQSRGSNISQSYATGEVSGEEVVGGLIGERLGGSVSESYATGNVSGDSVVGGLVGKNFVLEGLVGFVGGNLSQSYATGDVSANNDVGGLVGRNFGRILSQSYSTGDVDGDNRVGGLIGQNFGHIVSQSYATGDVSGDETVGGLVGVNAGTVNRTYATGKVSANQKDGGLVGQNGEDAGQFSYGNDGTLRDSYWNMGTKKQQDAIGKEGGDDRGGNEGGESIVEGDVRGLTTDKMTGTDATGNMTELDFADTWRTVTNPDYYPVLSWQEGPRGGACPFEAVVCDYGDGSGDVSLSDLQDAIDDFVRGDIPLADLQAVVDAFVAN